MHTLKKFIPYYSPYKAVFVLDLICAAMISLIDLAYPQILRTMTKTVFAGKSSAILQVLLPIGVAMLIMYIVQALCKYYVSYQGHMMGANMEQDMRQQLLTIMKIIFFVLRSEQFRTDDEQISIGSV